MIDMAAGDDQKNNNNNNDGDDDSDDDILSLNASAEQSISDSQSSSSPLLPVIARLGATLSSFSLSIRRCDGDWLASVITQAMDDCATIIRACKGDADTHFDVYSIMVGKHFGGRECRAEQCESMRNNSRDRMKEDENNNNNNSNSNSNNDSDVCVMDGIHCAMMHAYDTGYKLYKNERLRMEALARRESRDGDEDENEANGGQQDISHHFQEHHIRKLLDARDRHRMEKQNNNHNHNHNTNNHPVTTTTTTTATTLSKFVTVVDDQIDDNNNNNRNKVFYSFGYKFRYWDSFKNDQRIDEHHNGGKHPFMRWFVAKKYASMKEEIMGGLGRVPKTSVDKQTKSAMMWCETEYVKEMKASKYGGVKDYNIADNTPISLNHILSLLFHCNFTALCTLFSSCFRKLKANETDDQLIARNSNFREFI